MITNVKSGYAFSRNPVRMVDDTAYFDPMGSVQGIPLRVYYGAGPDPVFTGHFSAPMDIDLRDVADSVAEYFPEPASPAIAGAVAGPADLAARRMRVGIGDEYQWDFTLLPGGISRQNFRRLAMSDTDVFAARFLDRAGNFFFTTRAGGWRVVMKETELCPLYFLQSEPSLTVTVVEKAGGASLPLEFEDPGIKFIDFGEIRREFFESEGVLANVFDVMVGGRLCCRVVVERSEPARERYRLKFRNSLGFFDVIEIAGELSEAPAYEDETEYRRLDDVTNDFVTARDRVARDRILSVSTPKLPREMPLLLDMLSSDEVYLLDFGPLPLRVIPSAEDLSYRISPDAPQIFDLRLSVVEPECNVMPDIANGTEHRRGRIFTGTFNDKFN